MQAIQWQEAVRHHIRIFGHKSLHSSRLPVTNISLPSTTGQRPKQGKPNQ